MALCYGPDPMPCHTAAPVLLACAHPQTEQRLRLLLRSLELDGEVICSPVDCSQAPLCRWFDDAGLGPSGELHAALADAIAVLERSRHSFKSRELGELRRRLVQLLARLSSAPRVG
jgi:hypothetical protein